MKPVWMLALGALVLLAGPALAAPDEDEESVEVIVGAPDAKTKTTIAVSGGGDWSSLPPEAKKQILEQLKRELPPDALREALRALAWKEGGSVTTWVDVGRKGPPAGEPREERCEHCGRRIEKDVVIRLEAGEAAPGRVRIRHQGAPFGAPPAVGHAPRAARPFAPPGHDGLLDAIRALTHEIAALRDEVRALRSAHGKTPARVVAPGHPHPLPVIELRSGSDGKDGKGRQGGKGGGAAKAGEPGQGLVILGGGAAPKIGSGVMMARPPAPPAGPDLQKEMKELKAEMADLKSRMAEILERLEALSAEKR